MKVHFDREADAVCFRLDESQIVESEQLQSGVILDCNDRNEVVGFAILNVESTPASRASSESNSRWSEGDRKAQLAQGALKTAHQKFSLAARAARRWRRLAAAGAPAPPPAPRPRVRNGPRRPRTQWRAARSRLPADFLPAPAVPQPVFRDLVEESPGLAGRSLGAAADPLGEGLVDDVGRLGFAF